MPCDRKISLSHWLILSATDWSGLVNTKIFVGDKSAGVNNFVETVATVNNNNNNNNRISIPPSVVTSEAVAEPVRSRKSAIVG